MSIYRTLLVCKISDLYLLQFLRYRDSNWRTRTTTRRIGEIDFLPYLPCLWSNSHQILVDIHIDLSYLRCQKWIITESESVNPNFWMYRHNEPRPRPSLRDIMGQVHNMAGKYRGATVTIQSRCWVSVDTLYLFQSLNFFLKYWKDKWKLHQSSDRHIQLPTHHFWGWVGVFWEIKPTCRSPTGSKFTNVLA